MEGTIFEGGFVEFGYASFLHEFQQSLPVEGKEPNECEIIIYLEVLLLSQKLFQCLWVEALQILIGCL